MHAPFFAVFLMSFARGTPVVARLASVDRPRTPGCRSVWWSVAFVPSPPPSFSLVLHCLVGLHCQGLRNYCGGSLSGLFPWQSWLHGSAMLCQSPINVPARFVGPCPNILCTIGFLHSGVLYAEEHPVVARLAIFRLALLRPVQSIRFACRRHFVPTRLSHRA